MCRSIHLIEVACITHKKNLLSTKQPDGCKFRADGIATVHWYVKWY